MCNTTVCDQCPNGKTPTPTPPDCLCQCGGGEGKAYTHATSIRNQLPIELVNYESQLTYVIFFILDVLARIDLSSFVIDNCHSILSTSYSLWKINQVKLYLPYHKLFLCNFQKGTTCSEPHTQPYGSFQSDSEEYTPGTQVTYQCDEGYTLQGEATSTCGDDGRWSSQQPLCLRKIQSWYYAVQISL